MYVTYNLTKDELNHEFIDNLKKLFKSEQLIVSVESFDETQYLKSSKTNYDKLINSINNAENKVNLIEVPFEDIQKIANEKN